MTIGRHCAIDRFRARRPLRTVPIEEAEGVSDSAPLAQDIAIERQERHRLADCMDRLASADLRLITAAFFEGSTYSELAIRVDKPLGTVKSRIRRALINLRDCLQ